MLVILRTNKKQYFSAHQNISIKDIAKIIGIACCRTYLQKWHCGVFSNIVFCERNKRIHDYLRRERTLEMKWSSFDE